MNQNQNDERFSDLLREYKLPTCRDFMNAVLREQGVPNPTESQIYSAMLQHWGAWQRRSRWMREQQQESLRLWHWLERIRRQQPRPRPRLKRSDMAILKELL